MSDLKIRTEQMVEQCAYTSVSFGVVRALTFAGALGTDHRNGAVLLTESKQVIWGQEIVKRLGTVLKIVVNYVYFVWL